MPLNDTAALRSELQNVGEHFEPDFLQRRLREANRKVNSRVGRVFEDKLVAEDDDQEDFNLTFDRAESFDKIRVDDAEVDDSNYTTDLQNGTISFTTSWAEDNIGEHEIVRAFYTPTIFKDLEIKYAAVAALRMSDIVTGDGEEPARVEGLKEDIKELEGSINSKAGTARVLDHNPRFPVEHRHGG